MMKVLYDHQIFTNQIYGGISRYFFELMSCFFNGKYASVCLPIIYTNNNYILNSKFYRKWLINDKSFTGKTTFIKYSNGLYARWTLLWGDYDVFHPTYYDPYFIKLLGTKPFVITVYDMIHELYPESFPPDEITMEWKKKTIPLATRIIAISESTKRDLIRLYGIDDERISVIHLASSMRAANSAISFPLPPKYLLFVGQRGGYKNFKTFVEAFSALRLDEPEVSVVCAGGGSFTVQELELLNFLGISDRIMQCPVSDEIIATLYTKALAFVFPSLYEGFGIPILEAFNCGCPAILSNRSSLPEVGGVAAQYFDPEDAVSIRCAIEEVLRDPNLRENLIIKGFERAKCFSWEKVARETKDVYAKACNQISLAGF